MNEYPQREVTIGYQLAVGRFPVTFEEWDACVIDAGTTHKPKANWGRGRRPIMNVSWDDISNDYLPWLNRKLGLTGAASCRLLTEAEWEYCCRAGTTTAYHIGNDAGQLGDTAWFTENAGSKPHPVGEKLSNGFGLHDMHGNIWEWCEDAYVDTYAAAPLDGSAVEATSKFVSRVLRGGSWSSDPHYLRAALRYRRPTGRQQLTLGFRVARTLVP